jgi:hypothetical protein
VRDSLLDELRIPSRLDTVQLAAGHVVTRTLSWPPQPELLRALCPGEQEEVGTEMSALLYGDVLHPQTGRPLSNAKIQVSWNALDTRGGVMQERRRSGFTGSDGRYYVCWLPHPSAVIVEVTAPNVERRLRHINLLAPVQRQNVR